MKYPIDREKFVERWHRDIRRELEREPDAGDTEFAEALVRCMNDAYYAGIADGSKLSENSGGGTGSTHIARLLPIRAHLQNAA